LDLSRLRTGEIVAGLGGLALIGAMFLDWFGVSSLVTGGQFAPASIPGVKETGVDAWQSLDFIDFCLLVAGLAAIKMGGLRALGKRLNTSFPLSAAVAVLGSIAAVLILWRIFDPPADGSLKVGVFLGLGGAIAIGYGAYLAALEDGFTFITEIGGRATRSTTGTRGTTAKRPAKK
jgi:hypothetical protein